MVPEPLRMPRATPCAMAEPIDVNLLPPLPTAPHSAEDALLLRAYIRCFQQMPEDDSPVKYNHLNYAFHLAIVRISRYDILVSQMENLFDILRRAESVWAGFEKYRDCSLEEHTAIVDAIVKGDAASARRLSEQHYLRLRRDLESQLRKEE